MPVSEATPTTTEPLQPSPLFPEADPDRTMDEKTQEEPPRQEQVVHYYEDDWEEPHPGQRFSSPPARGTGDCGGDQIHHHHAQIGAHNKIGMAAKYSPYYSRPGSFVPRRLLRSRLRPTSFKGLRIPSISCNPCSPGAETPQSSAPMFKRPASIAFAGTTMDADHMMDDASDTDGFSRPISLAVDTMTSSEYSSPCISVTDFSHHLNMGYEGAALARSKTHCPREFLRATTPDGDPYGWEAELGKKLTCSEVEFRRGGNGRRSLLHRVFSLGPRGIS